MDCAGHIKISEKEIAFYKNEDNITLIPEVSNITKEEQILNEFMSSFSNEIKNQEIVEGITTDRKKVIFMECTYNNLSLSYKVGIYSKDDYYCTDITKFKRICFKGKPINIFASPKEMYQYNLGSGNLEAIQFKSFEDINTENTFYFDDEYIKISIQYKIKPNNNEGETNIGESIPVFIVEFNNEVPVSKIPQIYLMVYDFFCFVNFRKNIMFSEITIQQEEEGKFFDVAIVETKKRIYNSVYDNTCRNSITLNDCKKVFGALFKYIASRRDNKIFDSLYIPEDTREKCSISYESFLSCALSFEGEYNRTYPETKIQANEKFLKIMEMADRSADNIAYLFSSVNNEEYLFDNFEKCFYTEFTNKINEFVSSLSKKQEKKYMDYYEKITRQLSTIDYTLEEKFANVIKQHLAVMKEIIDYYSKHYNIEFPSYNEAGKIFSNLRNNIAHGNVVEIEKIHYVLYSVGRVMIYVMVLSNLDMSDEEISRIIKKIFY